MEVGEEKIKSHLRPADSVGNKGLVHLFLGWRHRAGASLALSGRHNSHKLRKHTYVWLVKKYIK